MKKKKIMQSKFVWASLLFCCIMCGCEDFLEVDIPKDQIDREMVFNDEQLTVAAMTNCYNLLLSGGFLSGKTNGIGFLMGCYTDELQVTNPNAIFYKNFYDGSVSASNSAINDLWGSSYKQIFSVNNILEGVRNSTALSDGTRNQMIGEALTIRGIIHFYLCQTFGNIPYVTTTDYMVNKQIGKLDVAHTMKMAVDDLKEAESLLTDEYPSSERIRINRSVVQAFLSRMYLYEENWSMAKFYADEVISKPEYKLDSLQHAFLKESTSAIWQLKPELNGKNTDAANSFIFQSVPAPAVQLSDYFVAAFETGDLRKDEWVRFVEAGAAHAFKYKLNSTTAVSEEYLIVIRLEEMYLISAEASARLGDMENCYQKLNITRNRAGLSSLAVGTQQAALLDILQERRVELFCEFGHRFYDLKRMGKLSELTNVKVNWQPYFDLLPLPENELFLNANLQPQNQGY